MCLYVAFEAWSLLKYKIIVSVNAQLIGDCFIYILANNHLPKFL